MKEILTNIITFCENLKEKVGQIADKKETDPIWTKTEQTIVNELSQRAADLNSDVSA